MEFHSRELIVVSDLYSWSAKLGILYLLYCKVKSQYSVAYVGHVTNVNGPEDGGRAAAAAWTPFEATNPASHSVQYSGQLLDVNSWHIITESAVKRKELEVELDY